MKVLEFESVLTPELTLLVPLEVAAQVRPGRPVRVMVFLGEEGQSQQQLKDEAADRFPLKDLGADTLYDEPAGG